MATHTRPHLLGSSTLRVRFNECDPQGVAFNASYLTWCDDALDVVLRRRCGGNPKQHNWQYALRAASLEFITPVLPFDSMRIKVRRGEWGTTSFVIEFEGSVARRQVFRARCTYVGIGVGADSRQPKVPPPAIRRALGPNSSDFDSRE